MKQKACFFHLEKCIKLSQTSRCPQEVMSDLENQEDAYRELNFTVYDMEYIR